MTIDIERLHVSTCDVKPINVDAWFGAEDPEDWPEVWEPATHEDGSGREWNVIVRHNDVIAVVFNGIPETEADDMAEVLGPDAVSFFMRNEVSLSPDPEREFDGCENTFHDPERHHEDVEWDGLHDEYLCPECREARDRELFEDAFREVMESEVYADGPMMNYWYPIEEDAREYSSFDPVHAAASLTDLPLCVVLVDGEYGLALTGGGMDLSWEICDGFVLLGKCPPVHFSDLPRLAGSGYADARHQRVLTGMRRSLEFVRDNAQQRLSRLDDLVEWARKEKEAVDE